MTTRPASGQPTVYVIAGPNGAGKTTFATEFLPHHVDCREFLNADLIAAGLAPFAPESQNIRAARLLLERFEELSKDKQSFGFETTLSGRSYLGRLKALKDLGYLLFAYFLWLPSDDFAVDRVANRVRQGGHSVPEFDIRRRYRSGLRNFLSTYLLLFDGWRIYDAAHSSPTLIAANVDGTMEIVDEELFLKIQRSVSL